MRVRILLNNSPKLHGYNCIHKHQPTLVQDTATKQNTTSTNPTNGYKWHMCGKLPSNNWHIQAKLPWNKARAIPNRPKIICTPSFSHVRWAVLIRNAQRAHNAPSAFPWQRCSQYSIYVDGSIHPRRIWWSLPRFKFWGSSLHKDRFYQMKSPNRVAKACKDGIILWP